MAIEVLLVADDFAAARRIVEATRAEAPDVLLRLVTSSEEAFALLRLQPVCCVLLADAIADENVFRSLQRLRAEQAAPVVILASRPSPRAAVRAIQLGAEDYLDLTEPDPRAVVRKPRELAVTSSCNVLTQTSGRTRS